MEGLAEACAGQEEDKASSSQEGQATEGLDPVAQVPKPAVEDKQQQESQDQQQHEQLQPQQQPQQLKPPPCQYFYAVRKCDSLKAPAVFLNYEDCSLYIDQDENDETVEYKRFDIILDAMEYIYEFIAGAAKLHSTSADTAAATYPVAAPGSTAAAGSNPATSVPPEGDETIPVPTTTTAPPSVTTNMPPGDANTAASMAASSGVVIANSNTTEGGADNTPPDTTTAAVSVPATTTTDLTTAVSTVPPPPPPMMPNFLPWTQPWPQWTQPMPQWNTFVPAPMPAVPMWMQQPYAPVAVAQPTPPSKRPSQAAKNRGRAPKKKTPKADTDGAKETKTDGAEEMETKKRGRSKPKKNDDKAITPSKKKRHIESKFVKMFEEKFEMLKAYKIEFETCDVPYTKNNIKGSKYDGLGSWVRRIRNKIRESLDNPGGATSMDTIKIQRLLDLGFVMAPQPFSKPHTPKQKLESNWDEMFEKLKEWKSQHGNLNVPSRPPPECTEEEKKKIQELRLWLVRQRNNCEKLRDGKPSPLTAQKMAQLADIGFQFSSHRNRTFDERIQQYLEYREKHGREPKRMSEDGLGKWVSLVRSKYMQLKEGKKTNLTQEQADRLTELGFKWSSGQKRPERSGGPNKSWDDRLGDLYAYKAEHGDANVPQHYPELGNWVHKQRTEYKKFLKGEKSIITPEKFAKLTEAGFVFDAYKHHNKRDRPKSDRAARAANPSPVDYSSDSSSSTEGDERMNGGAGYAAPPILNNNNNSFRSYPSSLEPRTVQPNLPLWDHYHTTGPGGRMS